MKRFWLALTLGLLPLSALADAAADKDYLTTWLEENLSGAGRIITIDGFQGALSSQASLTQLTIADGQGIWLTLKDVKLDWSRSALFSGQISIDELSAGEIDLDRLPVAEAATGLPSAEAVPLRLPDLPVSISIKGIAAHKIVLGASILGQPFEASLAADMTLAGGQGAAHLSLQRQGDAPGGHVILSAGFSNSTQILDLSLDAAEDAGGIAASLLHVPGAPATSLTIMGKGPLSDFAADVNLSTEGTTRLAGHITQTDDAQGTRAFTAELAGDPTPVFLPQYAAFFGPDVSLTVKGQRTADGALTVDTMSVKAQALTLQGSLAIQPDGQPASLNLTGRMGLADGPVTLPMAAEQPIQLKSADLTLAYDKAQSDVWRFGATISQLDSGSLSAGLARITAEGRLQELLFNGSARFTALGIAMADPGLAAAVGPTVTGSADFGWNSATSALQISTLALTAPGYSITSEGSIGQMADLKGHVRGHYDDLSRLSQIAGRHLSGAMRFDATGEANPISGAFDLIGDVLGSGLSVGVPEVDNLLAGPSRVHLSAKRSTTGTELRALSVAAGSLAADVSGTLASTGVDLSGTLGFGDLSALGATYSGSLAAKGRFTGTMAKGALTATAEGQDLHLGQPQADGFLSGKTVLQIDTDIVDQVATIRTAEVSSPQGKVTLAGTASVANSKLMANVTLPDLAALGVGMHGALNGKATFDGARDDGALTIDATSTALGVGQALVDRLLTGVSSLQVKLSLTPDGIRIDGADLTNPQIKASVTGTAIGDVRDLTVMARLANLGQLFPQFPGPVTFSGTARQGATGTSLQLTGKGPGQLDAKVSGMVSADYRSADLAITGTSSAVLANAFIAPRSVDGALRFDLRLKGPLALSSLSGPVSISGGRLADPSLPFALKDLAATASLGGGRVQVDAKAGVSTGGTVAVKGTVGLGLPYNADLAIALNRVVLRDPQLFSTLVNGTVNFRGPVRGGALISGNIALGRTELQIPSTGVGGDGDLPGLKHVNDSAEARATRQRAGLGPTSGGGVATVSIAHRLDVTISAPNQVFIRGRGLDAELGGRLVLRGTTANLAPSGAFNLLRGRLDILGRRLVLSEAQVQLQGALVPFIHIVASVESDGIVSSVVIDGQATDPTVTFTSSPNLPQEEVLAHLLFNHGLDTISAFQAAQLASAVGTLAGRGGDGLLGSLRRKTGLDNLDLQSDGAGNTSVTAGKYLSDKTYSEVTVDQGGKSSISLNYDVTRSITLKGHVDSEGNTGVGVFLKRDY